MNDINSLVSSVNSGIETIKEAGSHTTRAITALEQAVEEMNKITKQSRNSLVSSAQQQLRVALEHLRSSRSTNNGSVKEINTYIKHITSGEADVKPLTENTDIPDIRKEKPHWSVSAQETMRKFGLLPDMVQERPTTVTTPDFDPTKFNPACFQGLHPYDQAKTAEGNVFVAPGRKWNHRPMRARELEVGIQNDLKPEWRSKKAPFHIEGKIAAYMRQNKIRNVCLYLNARPCAGPDGCAKNLEALLPTGYTVWIQSMYKDRSGRMRTYAAKIQGTGEALREQQEY